MTPDPLQPSPAPPNPSVFRPVGALDISSVPTLRTKAIADLQRPDCGGLVVDAQDITRIDGVGFGLLAELRWLSLQRLFPRCDLRRPLSRFAASGFPPPRSPIRAPTQLAHQDPAATPSSPSAPAVATSCSKDMTSLISFVGEILVALVVVIARPAPISAGRGDSLPSPQEVGGQRPPHPLAPRPLLLGLPILAFSNRRPP